MINFLATNWGGFFLHVRSTNFKIFFRRFTDNFLVFFTAIDWRILLNIISTAMRKLRVFSAINRRISLLFLTIHWRILKSFIRAILLLPIGNFRGYSIDKLEKIVDLFLKLVGDFRVFRRSTDEFPFFLLRPIADFHDSFFLSIENFEDFSCDLLARILGILRNW